MKFHTVSSVVALVLMASTLVSSAPLEERQILPCLPYPLCLSSTTTPTPTTTAVTTTTIPVTTTTTTTGTATTTSSATSTPTATPSCGSTVTDHPISAPGTWTQGTAGAMKYKVYTPSGYNAAGKPSVPLVMMLHGCTQSMDIFSDATQYQGLAEANNFIVVFPSQSTAVANSCFKWYEPASQARGGGDAAVLASIVTSIKGNAAWNIDSNKVFVGGLSAGAAMSVVMGATYPDMFAAIAVGSGLEFKAGTSSSTTSLTMGGPDPSTQAAAIISAMGSYARVVPTIVFHGGGDYVVYTLNGDQVVQSSLKAYKTINSSLNTAFTGGATSSDHAGQNIVGASSKVTGTAPGSGYTYTRYGWANSAGSESVVYYKVDTMGHAWGTGNIANGNSATYYDKKGPDASLISYNFFMSHDKTCA